MQALSPPPRGTTRPYCKPKGPVYGGLGHSVTVLVTELGPLGGTLLPP